MHHFRADNLIRRCRSITWNEHDTTRHIEQTFAFWEVSDFSSLRSFLCLFSHSFSRSRSLVFTLFHCSCLHTFAAVSTLQRFKNKFIHVYARIFLAPVVWPYTYCSWMEGREKQRKWVRDRGAFRAFSYKEKKSVSTVCVGRNQSKVIKFIIGEEKNERDVNFVCLFSFQNERNMTRHKFKSVIIWCTHGTIRIV